MDRVWTARLRWRLRGAWQWKVCVLLVVVDAVLMHVLPIAGDGTRLIGALLLAGFFNLITIAVLAPLAGWLLRRRRPDLPAVIASDYAGAVLLGGVTVVLVVLGLAHRGAMQAERAELANILETSKDDVVHHH